VRTPQRSAPKRSAPPPNAGPAPAVHFSHRPFEEALADLKRQRGVSYRQLAYLTNLSPGYLNHLCKGTRAPNEETLRIVARALHVRPEYFREHRLSLVIEVLDARPDVVDMLFERLVAPAVAHGDAAQAAKGPRPFAA